VVAIVRSFSRKHIRFFIAVPLISSATFIGIQAKISLVAEELWVGCSFSSSVTVPPLADPTLPMGNRPVRRGKSCEIDIEFPCKKPAHFHAKNLQNFQVNINEINDLSSFELCKPDA
jgi:hypothetical protein